MSHYFISDLHLDLNRPETTDRFEIFLRKHQSDMQSLYILGDLFEAWIGDDDDAPIASRVKKLLQDVSNRGVRLCFQHGNRDFLIGDQFVEETGCILLGEQYFATFESAATLLMHGDTLCTDDLAYQAFRAQTRNTAWIQQFLSQSLDARRAFANTARAKSAAHQANISDEIMDVNAQAVGTLFRANIDLVRIIHGHTHRPAIHTYEIDGRRVERIVLPDWYGSGGFFRLNEDSSELVLY